MGEETAGSGMIAPVNLNRPVPGYYKIRMAKGGPFVPVAIFRAKIIEGEAFPWVEEGENRSVGPCGIGAMRNGEPVPVERVWPHCARYPISAEDYSHMLAVRDWALTWAPSAPEANPDRPLDIRETSIPEF